MTEEKTVVVAALLGFEDLPPATKSDAWLIEHADTAVHALTMEDLPEGGWAAQGLHERAVWMEVPASSHEATTASTNSTIERR